MADGQTRQRERFNQRHPVSDHFNASQRETSILSCHRQFAGVNSPGDTENRLDVALTSRRVQDGQEIDAKKAFGRT
jgi:hypothetical protein